MNTVQPVSSPYADLFVWKSIQSILSNVAPTNKASDHFQVLPDSFFCLMAFLGSTNYDNVSGQFINADVDSGNPQLVGPPRIPNYFEILIKQDSQIDLMGIPMPQACLCSNGYQAGNQLPWPLLYPPLTTFDFDFYNVSPFVLTDAEAENDIPLRIDFSLYGYNVPRENLEQFLLSWPEIQRLANQNEYWARKFTAQTIPGLTE